MLCRIRKDLHIHQVMNTVPLPLFLSIVLLASLLNTLTQNSYIQGALWGVGVAVIAMIILTVREMWQKSVKDSYFYVIFTLALISLLFLELSPIKTILIFTFLGVIYKRLITPKEAR